MLLNVYQDNQFQFLQEIDDDDIFFYERQDLNRSLQPDEYIIIGEVVKIINPN